MDNPSYLQLVLLIMFTENVSLFFHSFSLHNSPTQNVHPAKTFSMYLAHFSIFPASTPVTGSPCALILSHKLSLLGHNNLLCLCRSAHLDELKHRQVYISNKYRAIFKLKYQKTEILNCCPLGFS